MQGASRDSLVRLREQLGQLGDGADPVALQQLSDELFAVVTLLSGQGSLRRTLSDPGLGADEKQQVVDQLLGERLGETTMQLLRTLARSRWSEPGDLVDALENLAVEAALLRAEGDGVLDEVEDELFRFQRILAAEPRLREALTDRDLPADRKRALLERLLSGRVADVTAALLERAVVAGRGRTIERVLDSFTQLAARRRERLLARVTTAVELDDEQQERLVTSLRSTFGKDVRLQVVVDPSIVGGVTVRVGDELIDASVARQLADARRRLTGGASTSGPRGR